MYIPLSTYSNVLISGHDLMICTGNSLGAKAEMQKVIEPRQILAKSKLKKYSS